MKRIKNIFVILLLFFGIALLAGGIFYINMSKSVSNNKEIKKVVIEKGTGISKVGEILKENNLIKNVTFFKIYVRINKSIVQAGTYELSENMDLETILNHLKNGKGEEITITFKEGLNMRQIAKVIEDNTDISSKEVLDLLKDEEYIKSLIEKYWFLTDDILNKKIYYPLEGYLFPDTYNFNKGVTVKEIFAKLLDQMGSKLSKYKDDIDKSKLSVHQLITLASIVELEGSISDDRAAVAGVFYNRINARWSLGSDVTTYYANKIDDYKKVTSGEIIVKYDKCDNAYNTRCITYIGLPVGAISNPGLESIEATINYKKHNYYYFVADCKGKTYLNKDSYGHANTINKLKQEGKWCA